MELKITRQNLLKSIDASDLIFGRYTKNGRMSPLAAALASAHPNYRDLDVLCYDAAIYPVYDKILPGCSKSQKIQELKLLKDWLSLFSCEYEDLRDLGLADTQKFKKYFKNFVEIHLPESFIVSIKSH